MSPFDRVHTTSYSSVIGIVIGVIGNSSVGLCFYVLGYCFRGRPIASNLSTFAHLNLTPALVTPSRGDPVQILPRSLASGN